MQVQKVEAMFKSLVTGTKKCEKVHKIRLELQDV